jgi:hypothetical protein
MPFYNSGFTIGVLYFVISVNILPVHVRKPYELHDVAAIPNLVRLPVKKNSRHFVGMAVFKSGDIVAHFTVSKCAKFHVFHRYLFLWFSNIASPLIAIQIYGHQYHSTKNTTNYFTNKKETPQPSYGGGALLFLLDGYGLMPFPEN